MGSSNPLGGLLGGGSSGATSLTGNPYTGQLGSLASLQTGYGNQFASSGLNEYQAGSQGLLTPANQALLGYGIGQQNLGTAGTYANLGESGSTMETQDMNANVLRGMAEQANLAAQEQSQGISGGQLGESYFGGAGSSLGTAQTGYGQSYGQMLSAIQGLGNKSAGGGLSPTGGSTSVPASTYGGTFNPSASPTNTGSLDPTLGGTTAPAGGLT